MKDNISTLLDYLWHHYESWISAAELSQLLHVSTRQIRKYISILNEEHVEEPLVISTNMEPHGVYRRTCSGCRQANG